MQAVSRNCPSKQLSSKVDNIFSDARERAATDHLKASASEILQIFPLMREFASAVVEPTGKMAEECTALRAMCAMLEGFLAGKQGRDVDMIALVGEFLDAHKVWGVGFLAREASP